jgi:hypothetical protein
LLDLVLCNDENLCTKIEHYANIGKSDHQVLLATVQVQLENKQTKRTCRLRKKFFKADYKAISETLQKEPTLFDPSNVNVTYDDLKQTVEKVIEQHVPI